MKYLSLAAWTCASLFLITSCKSKETTEEEKDPTLAVKTTTVDGTLNKAFELQEGDYAIDIKDGKATSTVKVKRTNVSVPFVPEYVAVSSLYVEGEEAEGVMAYAGFGYTLYDADGKEIETVSAKENKNSQEQQLKLLSLKAGETGELTIEFDIDKLPASVSLTTNAWLAESLTIPFDGSIDKYTVKNFTMTFNFLSDEAVGQYQYTTSPAGSFLSLEGGMENYKYNETNGTFTWVLGLLETAGPGMTSGMFDGQLYLTRENETSPYYYAITGDFAAYNGKEFKYLLKSAPIDKIFAEKN